MYLATAKADPSQYIVATDKAPQPPTLRQIIQTIAGCMNSGQVTELAENDEKALLQRQLDMEGITILANRMSSTVW